MVLSWTPMVLANTGPPDISTSWWVPDPYQYSTFIEVMPMLSLAVTLNWKESPVVPEPGVVSAPNTGLSLSVMVTLE